MMFWFKLRRDVVASDLRIEAVKSEERESTPWRLIKRTVQKVLMHEVPHLWCCGAVSVVDYKPAQ